MKLVFEKAVISKDKDGNNVYSRNDLIVFGQLMQSITNRTALNDFRCAIKLNEKIKQAIISDIGEMEIEDKESKIILETINGLCNKSDVEFGFPVIQAIVSIQDQLKD